MVNDHVISMPDKWEYPWYAAWDLAFHTVALSSVDVDFAKDQLDLMLRETYLHPSGQIPAYEWNFSDVNPPVHAWAAIFLFRMEQALGGEGDLGFLKRAFGKLLANFTWWVNRKDRFGRNVFDGGFLGLDNIGVFDRPRAGLRGGRRSRPTFPLSIVPTSPSPRHRAASPVAERRICSGVSPASAIIESSMCSKYPWNRAAGPVSVPKAMVTPESAAFFRFAFACSSAFLYASVEVKNPRRISVLDFVCKSRGHFCRDSRHRRARKGLPVPLPPAQPARESSISPGRGSLRGAQGAVGGPIRENPRFLARLHRYGSGSLPRLRLAGMWLRKASL
jgi:hypothetical protein